MRRCCRLRMRCWRGWSGVVAEDSFTALVRRSAVDAIMERNRLDARDRVWVERDVQQVLDVVESLGGVVRRRVGL